MHQIEIVVSLFNIKYQLYPLNNKIPLAVLVSVYIWSIKVLMGYYVYFISI